MRPEPLDLSEARAAQRPAIRASIGAPYSGASTTRLNRDWASYILSPDQETRVSLRAMRARCRNLANNNDYVLRFLNKAEENVIGPNGIALQMALDPKVIPAAEAINRSIEDAWAWWGESCTADGSMTWVDACKLGLRNVLQDGELFQRDIAGYPDNDCRFALQFLDADQVDPMFQRLKRDGLAPGVNEIRMGVELNAWRRPVAYWVFDGHPSEFAGVKRVRLSADEMQHAFIFKRVNQTRGVPWLHAAMTRLYQLAQYEEAEVIAARVAACKMAFLTSKTGDEYTGGQVVKDAEGKRRGVDIPVEPGTFEEIAEGLKVEVVDWNHPNNSFPEFERAILRGVAMGLNVAYSTVSGDLRDVNFSSLRQGVLDEREGWRALQTFARDHIAKQAFARWLPMAILTGQVQIPAQIPLAMLLRAAQWTARGWDWVDPYKDSQTAIMTIRSSTSTLKAECAKRGDDWREVIDQRAREIAYAKEKGVPIDLTTSGSGGVEGDTADEEPERGVPPAKPAPAPPPTRKPNGKGALLALESDNARSTQ